MDNFDAVALSPPCIGANKSPLLCILALYIASHSDLSHPDNERA